MFDILNATVTVPHWYIAAVGLASVIVTSAALITVYLVKPRTIIEKPVKAKQKKAIKKVEPEPELVVLPQEPDEPAPKVVKPGPGMRRATRQPATHTGVVTISRDKGDGRR